MHAPDRPSGTRLWPEARLGALLVSVLLASAALEGCLAPSVRYTRPGGAVVGPGVYRVPRGWDYRKDYRLPVPRLLQIVESYIGTRYRYGGTSRKGLDCSGLVYVVFRELNRAKLPRTTRRLKKLGRVVQRSEVRPGDLAFFTLGHRGTVDHVGICVGKGRFAHASSSKGVMYSGLADDYFRGKLVFVRRLF